ncbi:MAG: hypothetical protein E7Z65_06410 [Thermoplasmata archaeon]|nr:hypothetical protein [Thermoplasmata archaeon]
MIENLQQMRELVENAIGGKCYLEHPQKKIPSERPFAVISMVGNYPTMVDDGFEEVMAQITYNIHIYAKSQTEVLADVGKAVDACAKIGFTRLNTSPLWEEPTRGPYQILTVQAILDKRGNTFN